MDRTADVRSGEKYTCATTSRFMCMHAFVPEWVACLQLCIYTLLEPKSECTLACTHTKQPLQAQAPCSSLSGPSCIFPPSPLHSLTDMSMSVSWAGNPWSNCSPAKPLRLEGPGGESLEEIRLEGLSGSEG